MVAGYAWRRFLDTKSIASPGERERYLDTVAEMLSVDGTLPPAAVVAEVQSRPDPEMPVRLPEYLLRVRRGVPYQESSPRVPYAVGGVVLNLTGPAQDPVFRMKPAGWPGEGLVFEPRVITLAEESAVDTLARIESGDVSLAVCAWAPLMRCGGEAAVVTKWKG